MNTRPMPAAVIRLSGGPRNRRALATLGASLLFAGAAIGGYAARPYGDVPSVSIRSTPDALPVLNEGGGWPFETPIAHVVSVVGDPFPLDALSAFSPSAGILLLGLVVLVSLGLFWLGRAFDWGAPAAVQATWAEIRQTLRPLGQRPTSHVDLQPAYTHAPTKPRALPS